MAKRTWATGVTFRNTKPSKYGSPLKAIHQACQKCMGGMRGCVEECESAPCYLWQFRMGCGPKSAAKKGIDVDRKAHPETEKWRDGPRKYPQSQLNAIRKFCLECVEGSKEVRECGEVDCPLYPFRFGIRPETAIKQGKIIEPIEDVQ